MRWLNIDGDSLEKGIVAGKIFKNVWAGNLDLYRKAEDSFVDLKPLEIARLRVKDLREKLLETPLQGEDNPLIAASRAFEEFPKCYYLLDFDEANSEGQTEAPLRSVAAIIRAVLGNILWEAPWEFSKQSLTKLNRNDIRAYYERWRELSMETMPIEDEARILREQAEQDEARISSEPIRKEITSHD